MFILSQNLCLDVLVQPRTGWRSFFRSPNAVEIQRVHKVDGGEHSHTKQDDIAALHFFRMH